MTIGKWWQPSKYFRLAVKWATRTKSWMHRPVWMDAEQWRVKRFWTECPLSSGGTSSVPWDQADTPFPRGFSTQSTAAAAALSAQWDQPDGPDWPPSYCGERRQHIQERPEELENAQFMVLCLRQVLRCSTGITVVSPPHPWESSQSLPCQSPLCLFVLSCSCQLWDERDKKMQMEEIKS